MRDVTKFTEVCQPNTHILEHVISIKCFYSHLIKNLKPNVFQVFQEFLSKIATLHNGRNHNFSGKVISQVQITGANHFRVEHPDSSFSEILIENKLKNKLFSFSQNNLKMHHYNI